MNREVLRQYLRIDASQILDQTEPDVRFRRAGMNQTKSYRYDVDKSREESGRKFNQPDLATTL